MMRSEISGMVGMAALVACLTVSALVSACQRGADARTAREFGEVAAMGAAEHVESEPSNTVSGHVLRGPAPPPVYGPPPDDSTGFIDRLAPRLPRTPSQVVSLPHGAAATELRAAFVQQLVLSPLDVPLDGAGAGAAGGGCALVRLHSPDHLALACEGLQGVSWDGARAFESERWRALGATGSLAARTSDGWLFAGSEALVEALHQPSPATNETDAAAHAWAAAVARGDHRASLLWAFAQPEAVNALFDTGGTDEAFELAWFTNHAVRLHGSTTSDLVPRLLGSARAHIVTSLADESAAATAAYAHLLPDDFVTYQRWVQAAVIHGLNTLAPHAVDGWLGRLRYATSEAGWTLDVPAPACDAPQRQAASLAAAAFFVAVIGVRPDAPHWTPATTPPSVEACVPIASGTWRLTLPARSPTVTTGTGAWTASVPTALLVADVGGIAEQLVPDGLGLLPFALPAARVDAAIGPAERRASAPHRQAWAALPLDAATLGESFGDWALPPWLVSDPLRTSFDQFETNYALTELSTGLVVIAPGIAYTAPTGLSERRAPFVDAETWTAWQTASDDPWRMGDLAAAVAVLVSLPEAYGDPDEVFPFLPVVAQVLPSVAALLRATESVVVTHDATDALVLRLRTGAAIPVEPATFTQEVSTLRSLLRTSLGVADPETFAIVDPLLASLRWVPVEPTLIDLRIGWNATLVPSLTTAAMMTVQAFGTYLLRSKTTEAVMATRRMADSAVAAWYHADGEPTDPATARFPPSIRVTPPWPSVCSAEPMHVPSEVWSDAGWDILHFRPQWDDEPHRYRYQFDSSGEGPNATFTATAFGDLDGDCVYSTFTRTGWIDPEYEEVRLGPLHIENELE
jgi:hypothetical protein